MHPANTSDLDLLIFSDWLEEMSRLDEAAIIREDVVTEPELGWHYEYRSVGFGGVGDGGVGGGVGVGRNQEIKT